MRTHSYKWLFWGITRNNRLLLVEKKSILVLLMPSGMLRMCFQTCLASSYSFKGFRNFFIHIQVFSEAEGISKVLFSCDIMMLVVVVLFFFSCTFEYYYYHIYLFIFIILKRKKKYVHWMLSQKVTTKFHLEFHSQITSKGVWYHIKSNMTRGCWYRKTDGSVYNGKCLASGDAVFVLLKTRLAQCYWLGRIESSDRRLKHDCTAFLCWC